MRALRRAARVVCEWCDEGAAVRALCESCSSTLYGQLVTRVLCRVSWFECCDEVVLEGFVLATRVAFECGLVRGRATVCESSAVRAKGERKFDVLCDERVWCASRAKVEGHGACVQEVRACEPGEVWWCASLPEVGRRSSVADES